MTLLALIACILTGFAIYNLTCAFVDVPTAKTSKMMMLSKKQQGIRNEKLFDVYITKIAGRLAPLIHMDKLKRDKLQTVLTIANIQLSPEVYLLKAHITAGLVALCALPLLPILPLFVPILIGLAVVLWFSTYYSAFDYVKKRRKLMEAEIPRFALTIAQNLENDRDVLKILSSYRRMAGKDFAQELDQTVADMKTGNPSVIPMSAPTRERCFPWVHWQTRPSAGSAFWPTDPSTGFGKMAQWRSGRRTSGCRPNSPCTATRRISLCFPSICATNSSQPAIRLSAT